MAMCQACQEGRHWDCGMQTWCECDCAGPEGDYPEEFEDDHGDSEWYAEEDYYPWDEDCEDEDDDDPKGHGLECTCETCLQNHPERVIYLEDEEESDG